MAELTSKERISRVLKRQPVDRLAWTTLVDGHTLSALPDHLACPWPLDFYRYLGCDILQYGNYAMPRELWPTGPADLVTPDVRIETEDFPDGSRVVRRNSLVCSQPSSNVENKTEPWNSIAI